MNDLDRYLSPEDRGHPSLAGFDSAEQEASILLADIKGFTSFSEGRSPAEIVKILNVYFAEIIDTVFSHGGTIDKFIGDCVMAVFGAPVAKSDHAHRALMAALEIRRRVRSLNVEREKSSLPILKVGFAVNSGVIVSGSVGSAARRDFTVIGDAVNLASRIEDFVTGDEILVGQRTFSDIKSIVMARKLPPIKVKGKQELVHIYEILECEAPPTSGGEKESDNG